MENESFFNLLDELSVRQSEFTLENLLINDNGTECIWENCENQSGTLEQPKLLFILQIPK